MLQIEIEVHPGPVFEFIVNAQGRVEPDEMDKALADVIATLESGNGAYAVVYNIATSIPIPDPSRRRAAVSIWNAHRAEYESRCCGAAYVIRSGLMRGAVTAILWMFRTKVPQKTFAYSEDARAWSQNQVFKTSLV